MFNMLNVGGLVDARRPHIGFVGAFLACCLRCPRLSQLYGCLELLHMFIVLARVIRSLCDVHRLFVRCLYDVDVLFSVC